MMPKPRLALVGRLGSGKSHLARALASETGGRVISFGSSVYEACEAVLDRPIDKARPEDRKMLVDVGTHWGRRGEAIDPRHEDALSKVWGHPRGYPNIWVDALDRKLSNSDIGQVIVLDDLRFPNEANYLLHNRFHLLLVWCSDLTRAERLEGRGDSYAAGVDSHESEALPIWLTAQRSVGENVPAIWYDTRPVPSASPSDLSFRSVVSMLKSAEAFEDARLRAAQAWRSLLENYQCRN
jgi:hypothetical protein